MTVFRVYFKFAIMRAVSGRHLTEEGVIHEACVFEDEEDEDEVVDDRESVISTQTLSTLHNGFNDFINSAAPRSESIVSSTFHNLFDSADAVPLTDDGGVLKKLLVAGNGAQVTEQDIVSYHYSAYFEDQPFATTHLHKYPVRHRIGVTVGATLPCLGVDIALQSMRSGETALFLTSPAYGYGRLGVMVKGNVPPDANLLWKVEVLEVTRASACDDLLMLTSVKERHEVPFEKLYTAASEEKEKGSHFYHRGDYFLARRSYSRALRLMQESIPHDASEEEKMIGLCLKLLRNLAQTSLKLKNNVECCRYADEALELDENDFTALRKKSTALINLGQYDNARKCLNRCGQLCPSELKHKLEEERKRLNEESERSKENSKKLESVMAKALFSPSPKAPASPKVPAVDNVPTLNQENAVDFVEVPTEFQKAITDDLDKLQTSKATTPQSLDYHLDDLTDAEVAFIDHEARKRGFTCTKMAAEIGRLILFIQKKPE